MEDFQRVTKFVYQFSGIYLSDVKKNMVEGRLRKRLKVLGFSDYNSYVNFALGMKSGDETLHLIDCVTTNKTDFYRERQHFDFLVDKLIPEFKKNDVLRGRPLRIWSAGCSSGEEPYTLSMALHEWNITQIKPLDFEIYATDISLSMLKEANLALYTEADVAPISMAMRSRYLLRSKTNKNLVRIAPEVRRNVSFSMLNLQDSVYDLPHKFDIIFCRNVLIYFDKQTEEKIINRFCQAMLRHGVLMLGHSESINGLNVPLNTISPTIYKKSRCALEQTG